MPKYDFPETWSINAAPKRGNSNKIDLISWGFDFDLKDIVEEVMVEAEEILRKRMHKTLDLRTRQCLQQIERSIEGQFRSDVDGLELHVAPGGGPQHNRIYVSIVCPLYETSEELPEILLQDLLVGYLNGVSDAESHRNAVKDLRKIADKIERNWRWRYKTELCSKNI